MFLHKLLLFLCRLFGPRREYSPAPRTGNARRRPTTNFQLAVYERIYIYRTHGEIYVIRRRVLSWYSIRQTTTPPQVEAAWKPGNETCVYATVTRRRRRATPSPGHVCHRVITRPSAGLKAYVCNNVTSDGSRRTPGPSSFKGADTTRVLTRAHTSVRTVPKIPIAKSREMLGGDSEKYELSVRVENQHAKIKKIF